MTARRIFGLFVIISAMSWPLQSDGAKKPETCVYEVKLQCPQGDMGSKKLYVKDSYYACEMDSAGLKFKTIKNKNGVFLINDWRKHAGKYPPGTTRESPFSILPGPVGDVKQFLAGNEAKKTGQETINGKLCDIYSYKSPLGGWNCKLWAHSKSLLPIKLVMSGAKPSDTQTATYMTYKVGLDIPDSRFEIPKGYAIGDISLPKDRAASPKPAGK